MYTGSVPPTAAAPDLRRRWPSLHDFRSRIAPLLRLPPHIILQLLVVTTHLFFNCTVKDFIDMQVFQHWEKIGHRHNFHALFPQNNEFLMPQKHKYHVLESLHHHRNNTRSGQEEVTVLVRVSLSSESSFQVGGRSSWNTRWSEQ